MLRKKGVVNKFVEFYGDGLDDLPLGEAVGRSWVLLGGVLPVDFDDITLVERGPGMRFLERSPMGSMRFWEHERTVVARGPGESEVRDRLTFEPRLPGAGRAARWLIERIFAHRQRRLMEWFARDAGR